MHYRQPVTQLRTLNGRQSLFFPKYRKLLLKINIECSYIEKEQSNTFLLNKKKKYLCKNSCSSFQAWGMLQSHDSRSYKGI